MAKQGLEIGTWGVYRVKQRNSSSAVVSRGKDVPPADPKRGICKPAAAESSWLGFSQHHTRREAQVNLTFLSWHLDFMIVVNSLLVHWGQIHKPTQPTAGLHLFKQLFQETREQTSLKESDGHAEQRENTACSLSSVMLMIQLNWLLWRKITVNNLNFSSFSPRYLTFLDKIFS